MTDKEMFLKELKELLQKYKGCIEWSCGEGSDLYGIYGQKMSITMPEKIPNLSVDRYREITIFEINQSYIDYSDIK